MLRFYGELYRIDAATAGLDSNTLSHPDGNTSELFPTIVRIFPTDVVVVGNAFSLITTSIIRGHVLLNRRCFHLPIVTDRCSLNLLVGSNL